MDLFVFLALLQDGITTGAIYLLLAIGLLIVFSVTRVIFVPQGEFISYAALSLALLQAGQVPAINAKKLRLVTAVIHGELFGIAVILLCAAIMARGGWV